MQLRPGLRALLIHIYFVFFICELLLIVSLASLVALIGCVLIGLSLLLVIVLLGCLRSVAVPPALCASLRSHMVRLFLNTVILPVINLPLFWLRQRSAGSILRLLSHGLLGKAVLKLLRIIDLPPLIRLSLFLVLHTHSQHSLIFFKLPLKCFLLEGIRGVLGHI